METEKELGTEKPETETESPKESGDKPETEKPNGDVEMKATPKSKAKRGVKARTGNDSYFLATVKNRRGHP